MPAVRIKSDEHYLSAIRVLNKVGGTFQGVGPWSDPVLLVTDTQYQALVEAGVVCADNKEVKKRGAKRANKKAKS